MCFRLIDAKKAQHPVSLLCDVLGVSRAGDTPASSVRCRRGAGATANCWTRFVPCTPRAAIYGWPRVHAARRHRGIHASRKRIARLMRDAGGARGLTEDQRHVLTAPVGVVHQPDLGTALPDRHLQGVDDELGAHVLGHRPADAATAEAVDDDGEVELAFPRLNLGQV